MPFGLNVSSQICGKVQQSVSVHTMWSNHVPLALLHMRYCNTKTIKYSIRTVSSTGCPNIYWKIMTQALNYPCNSYKLKLALNPATKHLTCVTLVWQKNASISLVHPCTRSLHPFRRCIKMYQANNSAAHKLWSLMLKYAASHSLASEIIGFLYEPKKYICDGFPYTAFTTLPYAYLNNDWVQSLPCNTISNTNLASSLDHRRCIYSWNWNCCSLQCRWHESEGATQSLQPPILKLPGDTQTSNVVNLLGGSDTRRHMVWSSNTCTGFIPSQTRPLPA